MSDRQIHDAPTPNRAEWLAPGEFRRGPERYLGIMVFSSRWLQVPLYLGLIVVQGIYVVHFMRQLLHLVLTMRLVEDENEIMLGVLGLIDVVMVSNLLIMVIIGGYEIFVTRLKMQGRTDRPEWLSHINANTMKVKLALSLIGISSIHLLRSFIDSENMPQSALFWQSMIHMILLVSAVTIAWTNALSVRSDPTGNH